MRLRKNTNHKVSDQAESPFWISFADLMTALMVLFLLVMAVSLMMVTKKINEATAAESERKADIVNICESIKDMSALKNKRIEVNCQDNRINFGEAGRFGHNDYRITPEGMQALQDIVPIVLTAAKSDTGKKWFKQVVIEGFTDTDGAYLYNLHLSLQRSEWVMCSLLDNKMAQGLNMSDADKQMIRNMFLAGGVSFNSAKESKEASRRVELRLQFYQLNDAVDKQVMPKFNTDYIETCQI